MEMSINERIAKLVVESGESLNRFSAKINVSQPTLSAIVNGETRPSFGMLEKIFRTFPNLSAAWLIKGEGNMFVDDIDQRCEAIEKKYDEEIERLQVIIANLSETINKLKNSNNELQRKIGK